MRERGYSVGSVKNIHYEKFAIDTKGSNTDRHRRAGAQLVTARGLHETDILYGEQLPIEKILGLYDHDFVILEGVERFNVPKIITAHTLPEIDERINPSVFAIAGVISDEHDEYNGVPVFNALKDHKALVDYIEEKVFDLLPNVGPVSYTHLDVYKRQVAYDMDELSYKDHLYLVFARDGERLAGKSSGGFGPLLLIAKQDQFGQRWCKYVTEVDVQ